MRHGSLFSGIGGFDLAAQWMGWENVFQVEIDPFCQKVLEKNFPSVARYGDIKQFDGTKYRGAVDIISGGFPCQPFSSAGKRKGKEDDRFLWPEMLRVIRQVRPSFVVGENVPGIINMELEQALSEMESEGYITETFVIPACSLEAPHQRDRVWIIAYPAGCNDRRAKRKLHQTNGRQNIGLLPSSTSSGPRLCPEGTSSITKSTRLYEGGVRVWHETELTQFTDRGGIPDWHSFPTESPICGGDDGIPNRVDRIKSLGNAIVPQVAYEIFKAIEQINHETKEQI